MRESLGRVRIVKYCAVILTNSVLSIFDTVSPEVEQARQAHTKAATVQ